MDQLPHQPRLSIVSKNQIPVLKAVVFDEAVDASCFGKACELKVDPPAISASTLEVGFLFCEAAAAAAAAACTALFAKTDALSGLKQSFTISASLDVCPCIHNNLY